LLHAFPLLAAYSNISIGSMAIVNRLEWCKINLNYRYSKDGVDHVKEILHNLEGSVSGNQLLAVMGPTGRFTFSIFSIGYFNSLLSPGCGKTSLMNVLSGRITFSRNITLTGNIYYNSERIKFRDVRKQIGYVGQDEITFPFLTVYETLLLSEYFHSTVPLPTDERKRKIEDVIRELGLQKVTNSLVGNEYQRGISGGEYKRVLIGKELIKNPNLLFLDEPTSGLDSFQAFSVMNIMRELANRGRIVLSVIHQPKSSIFILFDQLLLLSAGKMIFYGPANQALAYFSSLKYRCPIQYNPADYFLDILSIDYKSIEAETETKQRIEYLAAHWETHHSGLVRADHSASVINEQDTTAEEAKISSNAATSTLRSIEQEDLEYTRPFYTWFRDYYFLQWRCFLNLYRNYGSVLVRTVTTLFFAVLVALIYRNLGYTQKDIQNRLGLLYFLLINQV
jgi:ABC-type multidrug transport system ATPase subunit